MTTTPETCHKCGVIVGDMYRHRSWHEHHDDTQTALQRAIHDLASSTKRSLQAFEAAARRSR